MDNLNTLYGLQKKSVETVTASSELLKEWLSLNQSSSGITVNYETALQASVSFACARVIAEGLAQVSLKVFRSRDDGGSDTAREHSLFRVLHDSPNEWQTSFEWREMTALHLVFAGNAYSLITRGRGGDVVELLPLNPKDVTVSYKNFKVTYEIGAEKTAVAAENILHIRGISWDGFKGLDGIKLAREAIGLSLATEQHGSKMFANGATIPGVLTTDQQLKPEQLKVLKDSFYSAQASVENAWKVLVLHGGLKYQTTASNNDQAQFLETRGFQVEEVCRHFRVMPIMVGHSDKAATYASAEQMFLAHVIHTLMPWYSRLEQSFNKNLLSKEDYENGYYTKFVVNSLLRGSHADRAAYYTAMFNIGALNPNEIRAMEEMNPYAMGEQFRVPMNTEEPGTKPEEDDGK